MNAIKTKILLIEDEQTIRDLYISLLKGEGYDVTAGENGSQGYKLMAKGGYDLVLLDIIMPDMDGIQVLEKLKKENKPEQPNKKIVMLTNLEQDAYISKCLTYGVRGYLVKSDYNPEQFLNEVKNFLQTG